MRIVFFGNADFGCNVLDGLTASKHEVVGVVTNKDKKSGRNLKITATPIKKTAIGLGLNVIETDEFSQSLIDALNKLSADIFIVIAYKIIPNKIYSIPPLGSINLHASLLPSYKGAAPIQRAIIEGEPYTGLSSFFLNDSIDGGELIYQLKIDINKSDTFKEVWTNLYKESSDFVLKTLDLIDSNNRVLVSDLELKESYAHKIKKAELRIDWMEKNSLIHNKIKAFYPFPSMHTILNGVRVKILKSAISDYENNHIEDCGSILASNGKLLVKCKEGFLELIQLQPDSKKKMTSIDFINGFIDTNSKILNVFDQKF